jgi:uncharacterized OB-fold protein
MLERAPEVRTWPGAFPFRYRYTAGVAGSRFLEALRDRGAFLGSRCGACAYTYVPARLFCERCFADLSGSEVEVGPAGVLESFTVVYVGVEGEPLERPVVLGLVRLDGADAVLLHRVLEAEETAFEVGMRVEAVLEPPERRRGSILDVVGFRPVEG